MQITQETFTWPFKDSDWKNKFLVGSLFALAVWVPLIGLLGYVVLYGYGLIIMRATMQGEAPALPKWEKIGEMFVDGLKAALSAIGYVLPGAIVMVVAYVALLVINFSSVFFAALLGSDSRTPSPGMIPLIGLGYLVFFLLMFVALILSMIGMIFTPVAVGQYARTGHIGAGYDLRQVLQVLRANALGYFLAWVLFWGLSMALSFAVSMLYYTIILCCLIPFAMAPISFYVTLFWPTLFGPAYREGWAKATATLPQSV